jgi:hypothetical protein
MSSMDLSTLALINFWVIRRGFIPDDIKIYDCQMRTLYGRGEIEHDKKREGRTCVVSFLF